MQRLHSNLTIFWKYIFPVFSLFIILYYLILFINNESWILTAIILLVAVVLIGIIRSFYSKLKLVYLDEVNRQIIIKGKNSNVIFLIDEIKKIDKIKIFNVLLIIKINKGGSEDEVIFVPKNSSLLLGISTEKRLKNLI